MQNLTILAALLPLAGVLVGAILQYAFGRTLENRKQLTLEKGRVYADYFEAVAAAASLGSSREILSRVANAKSRICIYGSPAVIRCLHDFESAGAVTSTDEGRSAIAELVAAMRCDMGISGDGISDVVLRRILFGKAPKAQ
jgi:hypothetical protein